MVEYVRGFVDFVTSSQKVSSRLPSHRRRRHLCRRRIVFAIGPCRVGMCSFAGTRELIEGFHGRPVDRDACLVAGIAGCNQQLRRGLSFQYTCRVTAMRDFRSRMQPEESASVRGTTPCKFLSANLQERIRDGSDNRAILGSGKTNGCGSKHRKQRLPTLSSPTPPERAAPKQWPARYLSHLVTVSVPATAFARRSRGRAFAPPRSAPPLGQSSPPANDRSPAARAATPRRRPWSTPRPVCGPA